MKKKHLTLMAISLFSIGVFAQPSILLESFASGYTRPVEISHAGDDRLFVVEQSGIIKILNANGTTNATPFLNIQSIVGSVGDEQGLLGLAFAPDYSTSDRFYVNYTNNSGDTVIARYTVSANPDIANVSATILLTIPQPYSNHNGGKITFGQDGYLYISTGDGGSGGDPGNRSQDTSELLGKLLRIDVSGSSYSIPGSNPFSGSANGPNDPRPEIWAYGLRNPWKFSFDKQTADIWIGDVGQGTYEEIDMSSSSAAAVNYGWRCREGAHNYNTSGNACTGLTDPIAEYSHSGSGVFKCSITGGYRYRGTMYPNFVGVYFFTDYCSGEMGTLIDNGGSWSMDLATPSTSGNWSTYGEDYNGELYVADLFTGTIYKLTDPNLNVETVEHISLKMYPNPARDQIYFDFSTTFSSIESVTIYNMHGKQVKALQTIHQSLVNISTKTIASGMYIVEVLNKNGTTNRSKLIIK